MIKDPQCEQHNGVYPINPKFFMGKRLVDPGTVFSDPVNYDDIADTISSILLKESPTSISRICTCVSKAYDTYNMSSVNEIVQNILSQMKYTISESILSGKTVVWSKSMNIDNYNLFRNYKSGDKNVISIEDLSVTELNNVLKYYCYSDCSDDSVIKDSFFTLGFVDVSDDAKKIAMELLSQIRKEVPPEKYHSEEMEKETEKKKKERERPGGGTIGSSDVFVYIPKNQKKYSILPYIVPLEFLPKPLGAEPYADPVNTDYHFTVGYYYIRDLGSVDVIVDELKKIKGLVICKALEDPPIVFDTSITWTTISFKISGTHPVDIFRYVISKIVSEYNLNVEFTRWEPFVGKEPIIPEECIRYTAESQRP